MKPSIYFVLALGAAVHGRAATVISEGHVDIGVAYEAGAFHMHLHQEEPVETEYEPGDALLSIGAAAYLPSPGGVFTPVLGPAGSPAWVLGTSEVEGLPFIGWGTEELSAADWIGNISLTLTGVSGPGSFAVWSVGAFGSPEIKMNSADGIGAGDRVELVAESHAHYFIGFTQPGLYEISLQPSGTHVTDGFRIAEAGTYRIEVVPEPSTWALLGLGGASLLYSLRRRRP